VASGQNAEKRNFARHDLMLPTRLRLNRIWEKIECVVGASELLGSAQVLPDPVLL